MDVPIKLNSDELASSICNSMSYEELYDFVIDLDNEVCDSVFTNMLIDRLLLNLDGSE